MKDKLLLVLKGFIIGAGKIIPGVSGGMLAMTLGVYDKGIKAISRFFSDIKSNLAFLGSLGIGIFASIVMVSKVVKFSLDNYYLPTMLLFIGLIVGGIPSIVKEVKKESNIKNIIIMLIPFILMFGLSMVNDKSIFKDVSKGFVPMFLIGMVDVFTTIVPGISGTAVLMLLGYYDVVLTMFSTATDFSLFWSNLSLFLPFGLGFILGGLLLAKIIDYLLEKHRSSTYAAIIGFAIASVLLLLKETFSNSYEIGSIVIGLILMIVGYFVAKKLDDLG